MPVMTPLLLATAFIFQLISPCLSVQTGSAGCGKALPEGLSPGGPSQNFTIESQSQTGGVIRRYLAHLPEQFDTTNTKSASLILAFHGQTQPARSMERITGLSTHFFNQDAIVVYPEGLDYQSPGQQWLGDPEAPPSSVIDDRVFANELLDELTSSLCIDESRIYVAGLSNGGGLTGLLACSPILNRRVAAFAGTAAAFYTDTSLTEPLFGAGCTPELSGGRKVPFMELHGLNDSVIAYDGDNAPAPNTIALPNWVGSWVEKNGCAKTRPETEILDGGNVTKCSWSCDGWEDVVVHYKINHFGHGWPSTAGQGEPFETLRLGPTTWNATSVILEWFSKWRLAVE
ncbi:carbohydrate esterase family 1 protein [Melanomma pulvis-pyrius CBS 109.77]|uniref:feruloyl esterase n=1 Tax=Melanomma pulvis-pyrius CBS 109.77 TaxID=1314802 RepID=A0A6A6XDA5_9PLEO|nr:carbohydrate esterase family 1 protein [Melanomma pulvis-pyrius CBS 109.77]